jgi:WD40 repeat protein
MFFNFALDKFGIIHVLSITIAPMLAKSVLNLLNATRRIAVCSAAMTCLAVSGWAQTTGVPAQSTAAQTQLTVAQVGGYKVEETRLGQWHSLPFNPSYDHYSLSSDGRHVAYIADFGKSKVNLVVDGRQDVIPDGAVLGTTAVSSDGKHVAYIRRSGAVVADGQVDAEYKGSFQTLIGVTGLTYSPDSMHLAYAAYGPGGSKSWAVVVDGKPIARSMLSDSSLGGAADRISSVIFSPDSKHTAYIYSRDSWRQILNKEVIVDGRADPKCDEIRNLQFSADSQHVAYEAKRDKQWFVVVDGRAGAEYEEILGLKISSDGKRAAYAAKKGGSDHWLEVVQDWEYGEGGAHALKAVEVGNAGDRLDRYFRESRNRNSSACLGGSSVSFIVPNDACAHVTLGSTANFSPDGKRVAFVSMADPKDAGKSPFSVVVDGVAGPMFNEVGSPVFSPDGKHVIYVASTELEKSARNKSTLAPFGLEFMLRSQWSMVLDGQLGPNYDYILDGSQTFNPDGVLEFLAIKWETKDSSYPKCRGFCFGWLWLYRVKYIPANWRPPITESDAQPNHFPATSPVSPPAQAAPAQVSLTIDSVPSGADIEIDGAFVGNTPSTVGVVPGSHKIAVKMKGFTDWSKTLTVTGGAIHLNAELEKAQQ